MTTTTQVVPDVSPAATPWPVWYPRLAGALYLVIIAVGVAGEGVVRGGLTVPGDAAATAERIVAGETLWRMGIAAELFLLLTSAVVVALIMYRLLAPVSRELAALAVFFNLVSIATEAVGALHLVTTLFPLGGASYLAAFTEEQLAALAMLSVRAHAQSFGVALIFFGWVCLLWGHLIWRSGYLPRVLGVLMAVAGACYLVNSLAVIVAPPVAARLFPAILLPAFVAELSLALWLLVKGVSGSPSWSPRPRRTP